MIKPRKIVFYSFLTVTILVAVFAFWLFSRQPAAEQLKSAFPSDSFSVFQNGDSMTLFAIKPLREGSKDDNFQGYPVLGKSEIKNPNFAAFLKRSFLNDVANSFDVPPACFSPRHGIRVVHEGKELDLIICYECMQFVSRFDGETGGTTLSGLSKAIFDKTLRDAGITIAP